MTLLDLQGMEQPPEESALAVNGFQSSGGGFNSNASLLLCE